jgi:hypothetical protein
MPPPPSYRLKSSTILSRPSWSAICGRREAGRRADPGRRATPQQRPQTSRAPPGWLRDARLLTSHRAFPLRARARAPPPPKKNNQHTDTPQIATIPSTTLPRTHLGLPAQQRLGLGDVGPPAGGVVRRVLHPHQLRRARAWAAAGRMSERALRCAAKARGVGAAGPGVAGLPAAALTSALGFTTFFTTSASSIMVNSPVMKRAGECVCVCVCVR